MTITSVRPLVITVSERGDWVFVEVEVDDGIVGTGEASQSNDDLATVRALTEIGEQLIGGDAAHIDRLMATPALSQRHRVARTAASAIEQALWDIRATSLGLPLYQLLGGGLQDTIPLYANLNRAGGDRTPTAFAALAERAADDGFRAVKLAPFDEVAAATRSRSGSHAAWMAGVARVAAVRTAIGPAVQLAVDCHGRFDEADAIRVAAALEPLDLMWLEEPVPQIFADGLRRITRRVPIPTASGEGMLSLEEARPLLDGRAVDVVMPDVKHCGGIAELRATVSAARMHGVAAAPHNPSGPVATVASGHAVAGMANFQILEFAHGEVPWRADLLEPPELLRDGRLVLSDRPGLGHRISPRMVERHRPGAS